MTCTAIVLGWHSPEACLRVVSQDAPYELLTDVRVSTLPAIYHDDAVALCATSSGATDSLALQTRSHFLILVGLALALVTDSQLCLLCLRRRIMRYLVSIGSLAMCHIIHPFQKLDRVLDAKL